MPRCLIIFAIFLFCFLAINLSPIHSLPGYLPAEGRGIQESPSLTISLFGLFKSQELHLRAKNSFITLEDTASGQRRTAAVAVLKVHSVGIRGLLYPTSFPDRGEIQDFRQKVRISSPGGLELSPNPQKLPFRSYGGSIIVGQQPNSSLLILEEANLEDYTASVAAAEIKNSNAPEAQKAQAVLARTFALKNRGRHGTEGFDLCDTTHCQLYQGEPSPGSGARTAAKATTGEVLHQGAELAWVYYHSTCGGHTADQSDFPRDPQAIGYKSVADEDLCRQSPHTLWQYSLSLQKIQRALIGEGLWPKGETLKEVSVSQKGTSGRAARMALAGKVRLEIDAWDFRNALCRAYGWSSVKSTFFSLERKEQEIIFRGRGLGHGLGLCQYGAMELSRRGFNYREILQHYYPNFSLRDNKAVGRGVWQYAPAVAEAAEGRGGVTPPLLRAQSEHFILYYSSPGEENQLLPLLENAYNTLKEHYSYRPQDLVKVTFYASTESYCRATGQPWWLGAATTEEGLHFQPAAVLQKRGGLSTYLLHEYTHWMVRDLSKGRSPRWLAEGLALLESGEGADLEKELINRRNEVAPPLPAIEEALRTGKDKETLRRNYYWAYRFTSGLKNRFGQDKILKFLNRMGEGTTEGEAAKQTFGVTLEDWGR